MKKYYLSYVRCQSTWPFEYNFALLPFDAEKVKQILGIMDKIAEMEKSNTPVDAVLVYDRYETEPQFSSLVDDELESFLDRFGRAELTGNPYLQFNHVNNIDCRLHIDVHGVMHIGWTDDGKEIQTAYFTRKDLLNILKELT